MCEVFNNKKKETTAYIWVYFEYGRAFCPEGSVNTK